MPSTMLVLSSSLISASINVPTTVVNAFLRAFCDASSTVDPKPLVITVFTLLFEEINLFFEAISGKIKFFNSDENNGKCTPKIVGHIYITKHRVLLHCLSANKINNCFISHLRKIV